MSNSRVRSLGAVVLMVAATPVFFAQDYKSNLPAEHPAIQYSNARANDRVQRLAARLERDRGSFTGRGSRDVLAAILDALDINADSQMLVFSKTSVQAARISPATPRGIYFNDDTVVAYVPGTATIEVSAVDPARGPVFYVLSLPAGEPPRITRGEGCLRCHQGPNTAGVPGIYVGSVIPGPTGAPLRDETAIITDHRTPFRDRWGGWYVTARRGEQPDRANGVALDPAAPDSLVRESEQNLTSLAGRFDWSRYLAGTSDIVALMTFEHQTQATNLITRVAWQTRMASHDGVEDVVADPSIRADVDDLVSYLMFEGEAPLTEPIEGVSSFARSFSARGPKDRRGRSLRDFDLQTRLFRYPLSYMIYSDAFNDLPLSVRRYIYRRVAAQLNESDKAAILEILRETKRADAGSVVLQ